MSELAFWTTTMELTQAVSSVTLAITTNFSIQSSSDLTLFFIATGSRHGGEQLVGSLGPHECGILLETNQEN